MTEMTLQELRDVAERLSIPPHIRNRASANQMVQMIWHEILHLYVAGQPSFATLLSEEQTRVVLTDPRFMRLITADAAKILGDSTSCAHLDHPECREGHDNDGSDTCTRCGTDLHSAPEDDETIRAETLRELCGGTWGEYEGHPVASWQYEVSNGDTRLGYWDWVVTQIDVERGDEPDLSQAEVFADSARGVYIPQHFAQTAMRAKVSGVTDDQWSVLEAGPEHEDYNTVWAEVLDGAVLTSTDGRTWRLYQDGDLWLIPD